MFILLALMFFLYWCMVVYLMDACWLCGACPDQFGCLRCRRTGVKKETDDDDHDELTLA